MPHIDVPDVTKSNIKLSNAEQKRIDKLIKEKYVKPIQEREKNTKKKNVVNGFGQGEQPC